MLHDPAIFQKPFDKNALEEFKGAKISQVIQRWLLVTVVIAFILTTIFMARFQQAMADSQINNLLTISIEDVKNDINEISDGKKYSISDMVKIGCDDCKGCSACCRQMEALNLKKLISLIMIKRKNI